MKEFVSTVKSVKDKKYVVLKETAFYPKSGGQPHDTGVLVSDSQEYKVVYVGKFNGQISHEIENGDGIKEGDNVTGKIDWNRRYLFMRYHTACHVLSSLINKKEGAEITGNQISTDYARIDFSLHEFDSERMKSYVHQANEIIAKHLDVHIDFLPREEAFKIPALVKLKKQLPKTIQTIRIVKIGDFDTQACAGCHVKNTQEIGQLNFLKTKNKGKNNRRVYFTVGKK